MSIRALTVRNPWARAMFRPAGPKDVENRTWRARAEGQRIAIHVGLRLEKHLYDERGNFDAQAFAHDQRDAGHVIGSVRLDGCHEEGGPACRQAGCEDNPWAQWARPGAKPVWHWQLGAPRAYTTPIPTRGALQFWEPGPSAATLIDWAEAEALERAGGPVFR